MSNDDIIRALNHTNAPSVLVDTIVAALDDLDRMYQMEDDNSAERERLLAENAALRAELDAEVTESTASMIALQYVKEDFEELRAENAALRARLDDCAAALLADAKGR